MISNPVDITAVKPVIIRQEPAELTDIIAAAAHTPLQAAVHPGIMSVTTKIIQLPPAAPPTIIPAMEIYTLWNTPADVDIIPATVQQVQLTDHWNADTMPVTAASMAN